MKLTDEAVIADLKDPIVTTVKQSVNQAVEEAVAPLREEMRQGFAKVGADLDAHRQETKEGFDEVNMRLGTVADAHAEQLEEYGRELDRQGQELATLKQKLA